MALPILDGNQSATTLSSVVTGGEHIVAHSVVSLGANAIANITSAVSGSVVSVSNFPSTQTIAGTVTANLANVVTTDAFNIAPAVRVMGTGNDGLILQGVDSGNIGVNILEGGAIPVVGRDNNPLPISGTVTANVNFEADTNGSSPQKAALIGFDDSGTLIPVGFSDGLPVNIIGAGINGSVPISGTVTAVAPNGSLTTRFGSPTTANTAFATSAVTNANRKYLLIQNVTTGSNVITVGIGFTPTTTQGIQLTAGAGITFESSYIPTGAVYVLSSVTASNFTVLEA